MTAHPRKRGKRTVETDQFDTFVRRVLRAYARRVADGDIEALRSLSQLSSEVDAVTRQAVAGLKRFPYSWSEIADRLGTSRQAAQMRYGDRTDRGGLDRRIVTAGMAVTVATLVEVFADHYPGVPAASICPGCGFRYPDGVLDCPTVAVVRPVLYRRRNEDTRALGRLSPDQLADLHGRSYARNRRAAARQAARPCEQASGRTSDLFDLGR